MTRPDSNPRTRPTDLCNCERRCGDAKDEEGVCKGLPREPDPPLVEIVLVPRW